MVGKGVMLDLSLSRLARLPTGTRKWVETCLVGFAAGLAAVAFQLAIHGVFDLIYNPDHWSSSHSFLFGTLGIIIAAALVSGLLLQKVCPEAAGSGIPQLKLAFWKDFGNVPPHIATIKFLAGVIGIGGGLSLGREGPSVQIGGSLGSFIAGLLGVSKQGRRSAVAAGSAAALAAAFNAPLAGVAFVLEELLEDLNSRFLGPVLVAAVIGAFTVHALIGPEPAFQLPEAGEPTWIAYVGIPLVAIIAALVGVSFQQATLAARGWMKKRKRWPKFLQPVAGALITWAIGMAIFNLTGRLGVFGIGYHDLSEAIRDGWLWQVAGLLLVGKWIATVACYGSGASGGIFSPTLFFGAMVGILIYGALGQVTTLSEADRLLLSVAGMTACLGAVVQAPVTAILIIFEMTHQFSLLPGLMLASLISQVVARRLLAGNFYEEALVQDGHRMDEIIPPRDLSSWQNLPVSAIAHYEPAILTDFSAAAIEVALACPYKRFPVVTEDLPRGVVTRAALQEARSAGSVPVIQPCPEVTLGRSVRDAQRALIESPEGIIMVTEKAGGRPLAVVTLHDLLRAQLMVAER